MASLFFSQSHAKWRAKWWNGVGWSYRLLGEHPGWKAGNKTPDPARAPREVKRVYAALAQREQDHRAGKIAPEVARVGVAAFLADYLRERTPTLQPGSVDALRKAIERLTRWCEGQKITHLSELTVDVCRRYLTDFQRTGAKVGTVRMERAYLSPAWQAGVEAGTIVANPWKIARVAGKERKERPPFWTEPQVLQLREACRPWLADIATVGFYSGIRISALLALEWRDIDFNLGRIHVRAAESKGAKPYDAPMLDQSRDVLQRLIALAPSGDGRVFHGGRGREGRPLERQATYIAIRRAVTKAKVPDLGTYNHILRHSFATWAIGKGVPLKQVSRWMGHSSVAMTEKYAHAAPGDSERWAEFLTKGEG